MKKLLALLLCLTMVLSMVACGGGNTETQDTTPATTQGNNEPAPTETEAQSSLAGATIEVATRLADDSLAALKDLVAQFQEETGVKVTLTEYSSDDYEAAMKTRMASNELPDVWETHGWSRLRYGEYLTPVNDEPWYAKQNGLAKGILEGDGGVAYGLMLDAMMNCVAVNLTKATELGIDPYSWETLDDFVADCKVAKDAGVIPMGATANAGMLPHSAGMWTSYDDAIYQDADAQLDGTWDWEDNMDQLEWFAGLLEAGYYWDDVSTMSGDTAKERLANGDALCWFGHDNGLCKALHNLNPDNEFILVPFPAVKEGSGTYIAGGEGYTVGFWNETKEPEACRAWLAFLAENGSPMITAMPCVEGLEGDSSDYAVQVATATQEKFPDAIYVNFWDREYMPSGMWGVYGEAAGMLCADWSEESLVKINDFLKTNYNEKYAAAHG